jgi:prephenate dehydrogenase
MIKYGTTEVDPKLIGEAELIIFALYPTVFIEWIEKYQKYFKPGALITDVTGVKGSVVGTVQSMLREDVEFISAHPMAGRERSGVEYSDPKVFQGANYIVTPTENNTAEAIELCKRLGEILGFARISVLSPEEHDEMIAFLSQLTHCIAVALMTCNEADGLEKYTGDSFRDLTRIAKINDAMWSELFLMNKDALIKEMDSFIGEVEKMKEMLILGDRDGLRAMMRKSTDRRSLFDKPTV